MFSWDGQKPKQITPDVKTSKNGEDHTRSVSTEGRGVVCGMKKVRSQKHDREERRTLQEMGIRDGGRTGERLESKFQYKSLL